LLQKKKESGCLNTACNLALNLPLDSTVTDISDLKNNIKVQGKLKSVVDRNGKANGAMEFPHI